ncbi:MAG: methyltransferase family protein [Gemmatimonadaceae bacterium]
MTRAARDGTPIANAGVRFPPPFLFAAGFIAGWLLHRSSPLEFIPREWQPASTVAGLLAAAAGLAFMLWAFATFLRHRTAVLPHRPASTLVRDGPYRYSRNPMYVGLTALYAGVAFVAHMLWPLILLPIVLLLLVLLVIRREERYLASAFGAEYEEYRGQVRRWL